MANLPRGANNLNGGLAYTGAPAYGNTAAAELEAGQAAGQIHTAVQQQGAQAERNAQTSAAQMLAAKKAALMQMAVSANPDALSNMQAISRNPDIVRNLGLA